MSDVYHGFSGNVNFNLAPSFAFDIDMGYSLRTGWFKMDILGNLAPMGMQKENVEIKRLASIGMLLKLGLVPPYKDVMLGFSVNAVFGPFYQFLSESGVSNGSAGLVFGGEIFAGIATQEGFFGIGARFLFSHDFSGKFAPAMLGVSLAFSIGFKSEPRKNESDALNRSNLTSYRPPTPVRFSQPSIEEIRRANLEQVYNNLTALKSKISDYLGKMGYNQVPLELLKSVKSDLSGLSNTITECQNKISRWRNTSNNEIKIGEKTVKISGIDRDITFINEQSVKLQNRFNALIHFMGLNFEKKFRKLKHKVSSLAVYANKRSKDINIGWQLYQKTQSNFKAFTEDEKFKFYLENIDESKAQEWRANLNAIEASIRKSKKLVLP